LEPEAENPRAVMAANDAKKGTSVSRWPVVLLLRASLPLAFLVRGAGLWTKAGSITTCGDRTIRGVIGGG